MLFDARPNAIHTFGIRIKHFLTASNIDFVRHFGNTFIFCVTTLVYQTTGDCAGSGGSEEKITQMHLFINCFSWKYERVPILYSCLYRWFTGWEFSGLCYSVSTKQCNSMRLPDPDPFLLLKSGQS